MTKIKKDKKEKPVRFSYEILNIKLISNNRSGEDAYIDIIEEIFKKNIIEKIGFGKKAFIRRLFQFQHEGKKYYWGKILRFTDLEDRNNWINTETKEQVSVEIDPNTFPDPRESEFVFIPQAHRFALRLNRNNFTINNAYHFFNNAIKKVIKSDEDFNVHIQQSQDAFNEIIEAVFVEQLEFSISYTNSDNIGEFITEWMDDQLKLSHTKEVSMNFTGNKHDGIDVNTPLIKAGLNLAVDNGTAEARIRDKSGLIKRVATKDHPAKIRAKAETEDNVKDVIFTEVYQKYRNDGTGNK